MKTKKLILIQGRNNKEEMSSLTMKVIREEGYEVVHFPLYYTLEDNEKHLELIARINSYLEQSNDDHIILGHSFGGIIAYSLEDKHYKKVSKVITVGSPHRVNFNWFQEILNKIPYKRVLNDVEQHSYGHFSDVLVPFIFTKHKSSNRHKLVRGAHKRVQNDEKFIRKILK